jgi:predicted glycogen debranching enzyme
MSADPVRTPNWRRGEDDPVLLLGREWLVTNGLGGYASGTLAGALTRRYHGLLVAALPGPLGRTLMLGHLTDRIRLPKGGVVDLGGLDRAGGDRLKIPGGALLEEFRLQLGLPVWRFLLPDGHVVEKRVVMPHHQNTTHLIYRLLDGKGPLGLSLRPAVHFRPHDAEVDREIPGEYTFTATGDRHELGKPGEVPPLRIRLRGRRGGYTHRGASRTEVHYRLEAQRGYPATGAFWCPGSFAAELRPGHDVALVASTEPWPVVEAMSPDEAMDAELSRRRRLIERAHPAARSGPAAELVLAADQFVIAPVGRERQAARAQAAGDAARTVIAGYHWFTDWGRDTMISLEGLTLITGRREEARDILVTFSQAIRDGLIPNLYPEGESEGLYHTADATLWFFHTLDRYVQVTQDRSILDPLIPKLREIVEHHLNGTRFQIGIDPADGLLTQGEPGYQLTWMDAKVGDWVVTPRRGKAVELQALWYNALKVLEGWIREGEGDAAARVYAGHAARARESFNARFWYAGGGHLYDVVDGESGDDPACRPNQVLAISLPHPILDEPRWRAVMDAVRTRLLTPVGLRSLAPGHPDYKPRYDGDLRSRDAAYHQGTVWAWLIGPYIDAHRKLHPDDRAGARRLLAGLIAHLDEFGVGSIAEIFDAEPPFHPRGCIAQAWSVAEALRALVLLDEGDA